MVGDGNGREMEINGREMETNGKRGWRCII